MPPPACKFRLLLLFLLFSGALSAQVPRYVSGYYVTTGGDTLRGLIRDDISLKGGDGFYFKPEKGEKGVFVPAAAFYMAQLGEDGRYRTLYDYPDYRIVKGMVEGPVSLYRGAVPGRGEVYYPIEADSTVQVDPDNYRRKVRELAAACPNIDPAEYVKYRHREFIELATQYNACRFPGAEVEQLEAPRRLEVWLGPKVLWNSGRVTLEEGNYYYNGDYDERYANFSGGLSGQLLLSEQLRVLAELVYHREETSSEYVNVTPLEEEQTFSAVRFRLHYLEVPVTLQWGYPLGPLRPFIEVGGYLGIPLSRQVDDELTVADPEHEAFKPRNDFRGGNSGFVAGAGLGWRIDEDWEAQLALRYLRGTTSQESFSLAFGNSALFSELTGTRLELGLRVLKKMNW